MSTFSLPDEAIKFLQAGRQLKYDHNLIEAGEVKLKRLDELSQGEVWINTDIEGDPHFGEDGYYSIPAVSLAGECKNYDPEFILLWLPEEKLFGTWDSDHWVLTVFRDTGWPDIVASPAAYINTQWDVNDKLGSQFVPWPKYKLKPGRPF
jgi:hypothetical protein